MRGHTQPRTPAHACAHVSHVPPSTSSRQRSYVSRWFSLAWARAEFSAWEQSRDGSGDMVGCPGHQGDPSSAWWDPGPYMEGQGCPQGTRTAGKCCPPIVVSGLLAPWHGPRLPQSTNCTVAAATVAPWHQPPLPEGNGHGCPGGPSVWWPSAAQRHQPQLAGGPGSWLPHLPAPHCTSSSRSRCSSSWLVSVSPSTVGLPSPGTSATLSDIAGCRGTGVGPGSPLTPSRWPPGPWHCQALGSPDPPYLARDVPSPVPP